MAHISAMGPKRIRDTTVELILIDTTCNDLHLSIASFQNIEVCRNILHKVSRFCSLNAEVRMRKIKDEGLDPCQEWAQGSEPAVRPHLVQHWIIVLRCHYVHEDSQQQANPQQYCWQRIQNDVYGDIYQGNIDSRSHLPLWSSNVQGYPRKSKPS